MNRPSILRRTAPRALSLALLAASLLSLLADNPTCARTSPQWLRQGVVYEIFPRNFSPEGTFDGITARLDQLKDLGVNILWLMPIQPMGQKMRKGTLGSPYSVRDYYAINPDYGTEADLKRLISESHKRGLKVIIDIVANHTAWDSVLMEHPEYYKQDASGKIIPPVKEWTDVAGLNYNNPQLRQYMIAMLKHWLDPATFDLDGFRCDVAFEVPTSFWEEARAQLDKVKPDFIMLAEASKPELLNKAFEIDYSWPLHGTLNDVLLWGKPATAFKQSWEDSRRQFPQGSLHLRFSDNHDEARAVARFSIRGALAASALMFTLDGVPLLYNGMEVGDATESGDPALFEKLPIFWHPKERPPLRKIYQSLIRLRQQHPAFCNDRVTWLTNSDRDNVVTLLRADDKDEFVAVINFCNRPQSGSVDVPHADEFKPLRISGLQDPPPDALPSFRLGGFDWRIYHRSVK
jgi:cyclomaltodextrinase / maltogenic alpha-amylase / neopullulanase